MTPDDLAAYHNETIDPEDAIVAVDEVDGPDRTLVYGYSRAYDADHNETTHTVHLYKADGELHLVHYRNSGGNPTIIKTFSGHQLLAKDCVPQKRAYPERCDLDFARLLRARGTELCFTTFGAAGAHSEGIFAGLLIHTTNG